MRNTLSQLPLDFDGEEQQPSPPSDANGSDGQRESQYLAAPGVGIRVKAYKKPPPTPDAVTDLFAAGGPIPALLEPTLREPIAAVIPEPEPVEPIVETTEPFAETARPTPATIVRRAASTENPRAAATAKTAIKTGPSKRGRKSLKQVTAEADLIEVPADEVLFSKQYYTMGEVSEMFKVNQSLLRYWETEFDILQPRKNKKGDRYFRPVDIKNLHLIYHLLRQKKYTIEGAKDFLRNNKKAKERFEVIERLRQIRDFLLEWKAQL
jgi:DNA-binding transcriptional MerR regulator